MMNYTSRLVDIARRKERLLGRTEQQRVVIASACRALERPAGIVDRGISALAYFKSHPLLAAACAVVVATVSRRRLAGWIGRGWVLWRGWRSLANWGRKFGA
jgi:hypothetical protein